MAQRCLLHKSKINDFRLYMESKGYIELLPKNEYEILRMRNDDLTGPAKTVIIYRTDDMKEHYSVQEKDYNIVVSFVKENKK